MRKNIITFKGTNDVVNSFIDQLIAFCKKRDIGCYCADSTNEKSWNNNCFLDYIAQNDCVLLAFNHIGININLSGKNIWNEYNIHVYDYLLDHPRMVDEYFKNEPCLITYLVADYNHLALIKDFFPNANVCFMPLGGTILNKCPKYSDRKYDVICLSECNTFYGFKKIPFFQDNGQLFYNYTYNFMLCNPNKSTEEAIASFLSDNNIIITPDDLYQLYFNFSSELESSIRRHFKLEGMKALSDLGINVLTFGKGWDDQSYSFSDNIIRHDRIPMHELSSLLANSKIALCFMPWIKNGVGEKNLNALLSGAICVSDYNSYLATRYIDGKNIIYFDLANPKQMALDIKWLLSHEQAAETIACNGYNTALKYDTWEERYSEIYNFISSQ
ncbi:MAG: glycosyltransferase family 1 protein [Butyrivibrio sp.]|uniref:glycosyltransferase family protein n=1 Tax=Butyrivibrio sp. TaxID=28121 RepID=UPI001B08EDE4|nr:glycosyltransferase [Butyrivibrio sp.]MBO6241728.1 glycosyltransferase family 1 protein [Butyrivibrio sp.]